MAQVIERYKAKRTYQRLDRLMLKMASAETLTEYVMIRKEVSHGYGF